MTHIAYLIENAWGELHAVTVKSHELSMALAHEHGLRVVGCVPVILDVSVHN